MSPEQLAELRKGAREAQASFMVPDPVKRLLGVAVSVIEGQAAALKTLGDIVRVQGDTLQELREQRRGGCEGCGGCGKGGA
jgi:hypothetical protein